MKQKPEPLPTMDDLMRCAAAHSVEIAISCAQHPDAVLEIAKYHYWRILGPTTPWPEHTVLH